MKTVGQLYHHNLLTVIATFVCFFIEKHKMSMQSKCNMKIYSIWNWILIRYCIWNAICQIHQFYPSKITHYIVHLFNCYIISGFWNSLESELEQVIKKLSFEKEQLEEALKTSEEEKGIHCVH